MSYLYESDFSFKKFCKLAQQAETTRKKCLEKSNDAFLSSIKSTDHDNTHFHLFFTTIRTSKIFFFQSASWKRHCATPWREQLGWTLIENGKLVNQIATLATIAVKFNTPLFRDFYNHLSNYTKTIIRLRLVNIGEYSPRLRLGEYSPIFTSLRRIIVKYYSLGMKNNDFNNSCAWKNWHYCNSFDNKLKLCPLGFFVTLWQHYGSTLL